MNKLILSAILGCASIAAAPSHAQEVCDGRALGYLEYKACFKKQVEREREMGVVKPDGTNNTQGFCTGSSCQGGISKDSRPATAPVEGGSAPIVREIPAQRIVESYPANSKLIPDDESSADMGKTIEAAALTVAVPATTRAANTVSNAPEKMVAMNSMAGWKARVLFDRGSANLLPESYAQLDVIAADLIADRSVRLDIGGHASADGDEYYNLALSSKRAQAVYDALISRGAPAELLSHRGYGEYSLYDASSPNSSVNRRVEMVMSSTSN